MKFIELKDAELTSLHALEISENEYAIYYRNEEGNKPVVIEGDTAPKIFSSLAELKEVVKDLTAVIDRPDERYAKASR